MIWETYTQHRYFILEQNNESNPSGFTLNWWYDIVRVLEWKIIRPDSSKSKIIYRCFRTTSPKPDSL